MLLSNYSTTNSLHVTADKVTTDTEGNTWNVDGIHRGTSRLYAPDNGRIHNAYCPYVCLIHTKVLLQPWFV